MAKNKEDYLFKIIIIGDSGVGKTCLLWRLAEGSYREDFITTIGMDFKIHKIKLENKLIKLQIWEGQGKARTKNLNKIYYKIAQGFILVYDVTEQYSFKNIRNWIKDIEESGQTSSCKVLVGLKCDNESYRVVTEEEGRKLANDLNMNFFETSAKTNKNVNEIFSFITTKILKAIEIEKNTIKDPIKKLEKELNDEKNKNKRLEKELKDIKIKLDKQIKINKDLNDKIEKYKISKKKDSKESLYEVIMEKDKEIKELNLKLSRYPIVLNDGEKIMTIIFQSSNEEINYAALCKNTDIFNKIETQLYECYPEYRENENFFTSNGIKINKYKNMDENNIKNNDIIIFNVSTR